MLRSVGFFVYPGFDLLDLSGPLEAFRQAEHLAPDSYRLSVVSLEGGAVRSWTGLEVNTEAAADVHSADTLIVVGGPSAMERRRSPETIQFIRSTAARARRTASVCTGAFMLAAAGLLNGKQATTHWLCASRLQSSYPDVRVLGDRIFIDAEGVWTSAGITAGIDMALALIEEDLGKTISHAVARMLVMYYRRPGGQRQYSSLLEMEPQSDRIRDVLHFARENLRDPLRVERLAEVARLSVRQFGRVFLAETGLTPAKAIERLRAEAARPRVEDGRETLETIARAVGFDDAERMRQSFIRLFGRAPQEMRRSARMVRAGA